MVSPAIVCYRKEPPRATSIHLSPATPLSPPHPQSKQKQPPYSSPSRGHPDTVIESGIAFFQGSGLRVFGIAADLIFVDKLWPKDIRNDRNITGSRRNNPKRVQNLQKCTKIKDFMKSEVDIRYSGCIHPKTLMERARVPNGMPQLQVL